MEGLDLGPSRLPLFNITGQEAASLKNALDQTGFFDLLARHQ